VFEPPQRGLHDLAEAGHLFKEMGAAGRRNAVGAPAIIRFERTNPAHLYKACDRSVQRAWAEFDASKLLDIEHHGIAVLIAVGQAGKDEESGIGHDNTCYDAS
jgi:hypothetical protein